MKKRLGALLCALVMCLALLSPASALEEVCFTSLNNKLLPLASDTMPLWSGGVLYVPASLFDGSATNASYGVTLGVSLTQSQSSGTITLYSLSGILVFDLNSGICVDQQTGELLSGRAITRNGRIYLPLNIVVDFFGLRSSYLHTDYGYLVRIKNRDDTASNGRRSILTDDVFIDSAGNQMNLQLKEYQKSLLPVEEPETPDVTPAVPADPPGQELDPTSIPTYLAFRCQTGEALDSILTTLEKSGKSGVFFFAPEELSVHGDMVRRLLGTGHSVGILVHPGGGPSGAGGREPRPGGADPQLHPLCLLRRGPVGGAGGGGLGLLAGEPGRRSSGRGAERRLLLLRRSAPAGPGCPEQRLCYPG